LKKFTVKEAIQYGLTVYKQNWMFFLILLLIVWGAYTLVGVVGSVSAQQSSLLGSIVRIVGWVFEVILGIGLIKISLDFVSNKKPDYKDLYIHYRLFWKYLAGSILYGLIVLGGLILLVIPGIYWAVKYHFVLYLVVDHNMGPIEALKKSEKLTRGVKVELLLLIVTLLIINFIGAALFMIGLLVTIPVTLIAVAHVYKKLE